MLREGRKYTKVRCDSKKRDVFDTAAGVGFYPSVAVKVFPAEKKTTTSACSFKDAVTRHPALIGPDKGREFGFLSNNSFSAALQRLHPQNSSF